MFNNHMTDTNIHNSNHEDDFCSSGTRQRLPINWSSPEDNRFVMRQRFASPRVLSKSVPRRNKNFVRYKINRSLNFDIGSSKNEGTFRSPNSSSESGSYEEERQLTRSAKIMRALSNNCSPLQNEKRKIKKSLNFDSTPSPKGFGSLGKSPQGILNFILNTPSPAINKTLNFDTSPSESDTSSVLVASVESMDENQNQTPSRQDRKAKKSLNYLTPNINRNIRIPKMAVASPMLRSGLKQKIDNIVQINAIPKVYSAQRNGGDFAIMRDRNASTPRNLFNDLSDEEDERPQTPENMIRIIPESMSAIKKSHKKERLSRRLEHGTSQETKLFPEDEDSKQSLCSEERPLTPHVDDKYSSPTYNVNSIKRSHKKDKSKKRTLQIHSEEELSDTGSIFDYSEMQENISVEDNDPDAQNNINSPKNVTNSSSTRKGDNSNTSENNNEPCSPVNNSPQFRENNDNLEENVNEYSTTTPKKLEVLNDSFEDLCVHKSGESSKSLENVPVNNAVPSADNANEPKTPPNIRIIPCNSGNPMTPDNRFHFLQRIATESIKKSHKKVKDDNKKKFFKPRSLQDDINIFTDNIHAENKNDQATTTDGIKNDKIENLVESKSGERAGTPENVNSSRLLLSQFSSIKKSHKKDKHVKTVSRYAKIHKYLMAGNDNSTSVQTENHNVKLHITDDNFNSDCKENNPAVSELLVNGSPNAKQNKSPLSDKSSPNKRKSSLDESLNSSIADDLNKSGSMECESTEEEFQIYTPIKKRKSLKQLTFTQNSAEDNCLEEIVTGDVSRCLTPNSRHYNASPNNFVTPVKSTASRTLRHEQAVTNGDEQNNSSDNSNGRSTPKNMSTTELLSNVTSIKKSHKKDKRGSILQRSLAFDNRKAYASVNDRQNVKSNECDSPQPSTSRQSSSGETAETAQTNEQVSPCKTPPNCLKVKSYIRLLQTTSIKKSHKKVRDKKKSIPVKAEDPNLSDDGSIFGDEDKINGIEEMQTESNQDINANTQGSYNLRSTNHCPGNNDKIIVDKST